MFIKCCVQRIFGVAVAPLMFLLLFSCHSNPEDKTPFGGSPEFTTWNNICYDRAASIWLIQHFVDSNATFRFIEFGKKVDVGIPFDVPGAELGRQRNLSCFETVISTYDIPDPVLLKMAKLVHDIDVNIWGSKVYPFSDSLDKQFKQLRKVEPDDKHLLNVTAINFEKLYSQIKNGIIDVK